MEKSIYKMKKIKNLKFYISDIVTFKPDGFHIMLTELVKNLNKKNNITLKFYFRWDIVKTRIQLF